MKVKFIAPEKTKEFKPGQILEAGWVKDALQSAPLIYYPPELFELLATEGEGR